MLKGLEIKNFTVFEEAKLEFSEGLNVIIGENGTGKSMLLKLGYVLLGANYDSSDSTSRLETIHPSFLKTLGEVFRAELLWNLVKRHKEFMTIRGDFFGGGNFSLQVVAPNVMSPDLNLSSVKPIKPLFFPAREILSHYAGFGATLRNRELSFDRTFLDLADALALPPLKGESAERVKPVVKALEQQMGGRVVVENERFYIITDEQRLEMPLVAEGIRKIAMLAYLVMNGSIQKGSTLFWDEPEANLNPKMLLPLAQTLVTLTNLGVQIFIATHSLFLLRELEIQRNLFPAMPMKFIGLTLEKGNVSLIEGESFFDIDPVAALEADLEQTERYLQVV
jgi:energy-coupling factor transporter ATP-binding protein EcfA2